MGTLNRTALWWLLGAVRLLTLAVAAVAVGLVLRFSPVGVGALIAACVPVVVAQTLMDRRGVPRPARRLLMVAALYAVFGIPAWIFAAGGDWASLPALLGFLVLVTAVNGVLFARLDRRRPA